MAPPAHLLARLAASRRGGVTFDEAWPLAVDDALAALERVEREQWERALIGTRSAWASAFDREPGTRRTRALATIADDPDREPYDRRSCERCGAPIAAGKSAAARFCTVACQRAASRRPAVAA